MISFACKDIHIKDLIKCSFNLNKTDYTLFTFFMKKDSKFTIDLLSKSLDLERSSVQKSIKDGTRIDRKVADQVASGMKAWAMSRGATDSDKKRIVHTYSAGYRIVTHS